MSAASLLWRSAFSFSRSEIDTILQKPNPTLEDFFDSEELFQEIANDHADLLKFLTLDSTVEKLLDYTLVGSAEEAVQLLPPHPNQQDEWGGTGDWRSDFQPGEDSAVLMAQRYVQQATEVLMHDLTGTFQAIARTPRFLAKVFGVLQRDPPMSPQLTTAFMRVSRVVFLFQPATVIDWLTTSEEGKLVPQHLLRHIGCDPLSTALSTMLCVTVDIDIGDKADDGVTGLVTIHRPRVEQVCNWWMDEHQVLLRLLEIFRVGETTDICRAACAVLTEILCRLQDMHPIALVVVNPNGVAGPVPATLLSIALLSADERAQLNAEVDKLGSLEERTAAAHRIARSMLDKRLASGGRPELSSSALFEAVTIFITQGISQFDSPAAEASEEGESNFNTAAEGSSAAMFLDQVVSFIPHLVVVLETPPLPPCAPIELPGKLVKEPVGRLRLCAANLVSSLVGLTPEVDALLLEHKVLIRLLDLAFKNPHHTVLCRHVCTALRASISHRSPLISAEYCRQLKEFRFISRSIDVFEAVTARRYALSVRAKRQAAARQRFGTASDRVVNNAPPREDDKPEEKGLPEPEAAGDEVGTSMFETGILGLQNVEEMELNDTQRAIVDAALGDENGAGAPISDQASLRAHLILALPHLQSLIHDVQALQEVVDAEPRWNAFLTDTLYPLSKLHDGTLGCAPPPRPRPGQPAQLAEQNQAAPPLDVHQRFDPSGLFARDVDDTDAVRGSGAPGAPTSDDWDVDVQGAPNFNNTPWSNENANNNSAWRFEPPDWPETDDNVWREKEIEDVGRAAATTGSVGSVEVQPSGTDEWAPRWPHGDDQQSACGDDDKT